MMIDVLVIGAGPAGCHTATALAQKGYHVRVLEEHEVIGEPVDCSGVIGAEAFNELEASSELRLGEISRLQFNSPANLHFDFGLASPLAYIVDRGAFDRVIAKRASKSGAKIHLGARVVDLDVYDDYVEALVEKAAVGRRPRLEPLSFPQSCEQAFYPGRSGVINLCL